MMALFSPSTTFCSSSWPRIVNDYSFLQVGRVEHSEMLGEDNRLLKAKEEHSLANKLFYLPCCVMGNQQAAVNLCQMLAAFNEEA